MAFQGQGLEGVFDRFGGGFAACQGGEHLLALGTLDGNGRPVLGDVGHGAVVAGDDLLQVCPILFRIGGVDHQHEPFFLEQIEVSVVNGAALFVGDDAVLGHVQLQGADVAGQHMLQEFDSLRPLDQEPPHVRHIKEAAHLTGVKVFGDDAGGILDGHFPAAEIHHGSARCHMDIVQLGSFQFAHEIHSSSKSLFGCTDSKKGTKHHVFCASVLLLT